MTNPNEPTSRPTITVVDTSGASHPFQPAGLHEDVDYDLNIYTGELTVERVEYGPRGNDEWARLGSQVIAAWPADQWSTVTRHNRRSAGVSGRIAGR
jgi:hypothetical protein